MFKILLIGAGLAFAVFACLVVGSDEDDKNGQD